ISELRKGPRCNRRVADWFAQVPEDEVFLSVLTIGEIRKGVELIRQRDAKSASALDQWLRSIVHSYSDRILAVDQTIAEEWGQITARHPFPVIDGLLGATAKIHGLTVATRNTSDIARTGVNVFNPFVP